MCSRIAGLIREGNNENPYAGPTQSRRWRRCRSVERIEAKNVLDLLKPGRRAKNAGRTAIRCLSRQPVPTIRCARVTFDGPCSAHTIQAANLPSRQRHRSRRTHGDPADAVGARDLLRACGAAEIAARRQPGELFPPTPRRSPAIMKEAGAKALVAADPSIFPDIWPEGGGDPQSHPRTEGLFASAAAGTPAGCHRVRGGGGETTPATRLIRAQAARARHAGGPLPHRRQRPACPSSPSTRTARWR